MHTIESVRDITEGKLVIYAANPEGFCDGTRAWLRGTLLPRLADPLFEVLNPWEPVMDKSSGQIREFARTMTHDQAMDLGRINRESIEKCDVVFAILDGTDVDSGVAAELGYAAAKGKKVIGVRTDYRLASEVPACKVNLQVEYFIKASGGRIHDNLGEAILNLHLLAVEKTGTFVTLDEARAMLREDAQERKAVVRKS